MSGRDIAFAAFTDRGAALAERLRQELGGTLTRIGAGQGISLGNWTRDAFQTGCRALWVSLCGQLHPACRARPWTRRWWLWTKEGAMLCR